MKRFRNRFLACSFCVLLNLVGAFGYAQSSVLCLQEEGRHMLEFSADGYRCTSSAAMSEMGSHSPDKGESPLAEEHCGSCLDIPLSISSFATNSFNTRPSDPVFESATTALSSPAVHPTGIAIEGGDPPSLIKSNPIYTSLRSTVLLI